MQVDVYGSYGIPLALIRIVWCVREKSQNVSWEDVGPNPSLSFLLHHKYAAVQQALWDWDWSDCLTSSPAKPEAPSEQELTFKPIQSLWLKHSVLTHNFSSADDNG